MKTLQDQYKLIKEGKGHKGVFLNEAKRMFPNYIPNHATFENAADVLKHKGIISENIVGIEPINSLSRPKESYEEKFAKFLEEARKKKDNDPNAEIKKVSQQVEDKLKYNFDRTDKKNPDNQIFGEIMKGYYCEMKNPKNADKTEQQLRDIVLKNLAKDPIYYTKNGMFGEEGVGVELEVPGLGSPKEPKGKYKSSGYGTLKEELERNISDQDIVSKYNEMMESNPSTTFEDVSKKLGIDISRVEKALYEEFLQEQQFRKVIREMVVFNLNEVMYQGPSVSTSGEGGGRRFIPKEAFLSQDMIDKFNFANPGPNAPTRHESLQIPHIKFGTIQGEPTMLISDFLFNALMSLERGRTSRGKEERKNELEKMVSDLDPIARGLIKKTVDPKTAFGVYHIVNTPIEREVGVGVKMPLQGKEEEIVDDTESIEESLFRNAVRSLVKKEIISENKKAYNKIKEIESEAKIAEMSTKLEALNAAIEERTSRLSSIEENEDMKELMDGKKLKELKKEIKILEKYQSKCSKMYEKLTKKTKGKEIIDEDTIDEGEVQDAIDASEEKIDAVTSKTDELIAKLEEENE